MNPAPTTLDYVLGTGCQRTEAKQYITSCYWSVGDSTSFRSQQRSFRPYMLSSLICLKSSTYQWQWMMKSAISCNDSSLCMLIWVKKTVRKLIPVCCQILINSSAFPLAWYLLASLLHVCLLVVWSLDAHIQNDVSLAFSKLVCIITCWLWVIILTHNLSQQTTHFR